MVSLRPHYKHHPLSPIITEDNPNPDAWQWKPMFHYPPCELQSEAICSEIERLNVLFQNELKLSSLHYPLTHEIRSKIYRKYTDFIFTYHYENCMNLRQKYKYNNYPKKEELILTCIIL